MAISNQAKITQYFGSEHKLSTEKLTTARPVQVTPVSVQRFFTPTEKSLNRKRRRLIELEKAADDEKQMIIDAGQVVNFGSKLCLQCNMLYSPTSRADNNIHNEHHNRAIGVAPIPVKSSWFRKIYPVQELALWNLYCITESSSFAAINAVQDVIDDYVDVELGCHQHQKRIAELLTSRECVAFVLLTKSVIKPSVVGILLVEPITHAFRLADTAFGAISSKNKENCIGETKSSETPLKYKAAVGVIKIWVNRQHRRRGAATALLNCSLLNTRPGRVYSRGEIAFADPTDDGYKLACKYSGSPSNVLVYQTTSFSDNS